MPQGPTRNLSPSCNQTVTDSFSLKNKQMCLYMKDCQRLFQEILGLCLNPRSIFFSLSQRPPACRLEEGTQKGLDFLSHLVWILRKAQHSGDFGEGLRLDVGQHMGSVCLNWKFISPFTYLSKTVSPTDIIHPPQSC